MFSKEITETDSFLDMPLSSQALYFHLWIGADDDWFISPQRVIRWINANKNDLDVLIAKKFCIMFEDGVIVITHRKTNNYLRPDRYTPTLYQEHYNKMKLESGRYQIITNGIPNDIPLVGIGKDSIGSIEESKEEIISNFSFDDFRMQYPKKIWTAKAKEYFRKKIKTQENYDELMNGLRWYIAFVHAERSTGFQLAWRQWDVFLNQDTRKDYLSDEPLKEAQSRIPLDKIYSDFNADQRDRVEKRLDYCQKYWKDTMKKAQEEYKNKTQFTILPN